MQAAIFDLFGTLVPNLEPDRYRDFAHRLAHQLGAPAEPFRAAWAHFFRQRMDGTIRDGDEQFIPILEHIGAPVRRELLPGATRIRREFMRAALTPKSDALECLDALRSAGMRLAMASDCSTETPVLLKASLLGPYFPICAASALLGVRKPDLLMYEHVLNALGVAARDCVYIGDGNSEELIGAKRLGMTTIWVDNGAEQYWLERFSSECDERVTALREIPGIVSALRK
ncbi:MAG: HAD family hydrolase [Planctomycetota bacterium]